MALWMALLAVLSVPAFGQGSADLAVSLSGPSQDTAGDTPTYTVTVTNNGPSDETGYQLNNNAPAALTFEYGYLGDSYTSCSSLPCTLGSLPAGQTQTIYLIYSISSTATGSFTNQVSVTPQLTDPTPANNSASFQTTIVPPFTCQPNVTPSTARAESTTELVADLVLTCTGGIPNAAGSTIYTDNITISFGANVQSRILNPSNNASEALLLIDEPQPNAQFPCDPTADCAAWGNGTGTGYYGGGTSTSDSPSNRNVYQGIVAAPEFEGGLRPARNRAAVRPVAPHQNYPPNTITWENVPIDQPGPNATRTYRFTNLRFDATAGASALQVTGISTAYGSLPFSQGNDTVPISIPLATPETSLTATVRDAADTVTLGSGATFALSPLVSTPTRAATLRFASAFTGADKARTAAAFVNADTSPTPAAQDIPGRNYATETGFYNPSFGENGSGGNLSLAGLADNGTRYMATFSNIPTGYKIYVDLYSAGTSAGNVARLVSTDANGAGAFSAVTGSGNMAQLVVTRGSATAVWEVLNSASGTPGQYDFGVYLAPPAGTTVTPFPVNVQMQYAPTLPASSYPTFSGTAASQYLTSFVLPQFQLPESLTFTGTAGAQSPITQNVSVASTYAAAPIPFTIAGRALSYTVTPGLSGTTPASLSVAPVLSNLRPGTYQDNLNLVGDGGAIAGSIPVTVNVLATPQITSVSPNPVYAGAGGFTLTVMGTNFPTGMAIEWNGQPLPTTLVSATQATAVVPGNLIAQPGTAAIMVVTADRAASNSFPLPIQLPLFVVSPGSLTFTGTAGAQNPAAQTLSISSSVGAAPISFSLSGGSLTYKFSEASGGTPASVSVAPVLAGLKPGTYQDSLTLTGDSGAITEPIPVTVNVLPAPQITSLSPNPVSAGGPAFSLTVTGSNFPATMAIHWNSTALPTSVSSATQATVSVPASLIAQAGTATITAITTDRAVSNALTLPIIGPQLTSLNPATVLSGGPAFSLTIAGSGFLSGATVTVGSSALQPVSVSSTQISVMVPASLISQAGSLAVSVANPGGAPSNSLALTVSPLHLSSITPTAVTAGSPAFTLTLSGAGFASGAAVNVGSTVLPAASLTASQITVTVPASAIAQPATLQVTVSNPGGVLSNSQPLTVSPGPTISALSPSSATAGSTGISLTVTGTGFTSTVTARWNGQALSTSIVSATQLTAQVPAALLANPGTASVTVAAAGGLASNALSFSINSTPVLSSINPSSATPGGPAFTLTAVGTGFASGASILWNGGALATTFVSSTQLTALVPASLIASSLAVSIAVSSADGVWSNSLPFTLKYPQLTNVGVNAPSTSTSGQNQPVTVNLGSTYPVDLAGTLTLTFAGTNGLPDDPTIQFQNGSRVYTFTVPAGTQPAPVQVLVSTGTVAGTITITPTFTAGGVDVTPAGIAPEIITIPPAAPGLSQPTCAASSSGFTIVIDGYSNTRDVSQAVFTFQPAAGATLGTTQLTLPVSSLFGGWFSSSASPADGGEFQYTQPFTIQGNLSTIASVSVTLTNSSGTSASVSCQLP